MKARSWLVLLLLLTTAASLGAHDLFLRAQSFFAQPNSSVRIRVLNGTFSKSENAVARDRVRDLSVVTPAGRTQPDTGAWVATGDTSILTVATKEAGTYLVGASLLPREIALKASDFNQYLQQDGIPDVLAARRRSGELGKDVNERYSKHVKAVLQVGATRTRGFETPLGYPAEIVPLDNPYSLRAGRSLRVRALVEGVPVANQFVMSGGRTPGGARITGRSVRTDASGVAVVPITRRGHWYIKFISMQPYSGTEKIDYESKWATLTFQVR